MRSARSIRVQVADDHDIVIEGVQSILKDEGDLQVIGPAVRSGGELFQNVRDAQPDVLLLDVRMPGLDVLSALSELATQFPRVRVVIMTAQQDPQLVRAASEKGAAGYVLKEEALSSLLPMAIREVVTGGLWFSPRASQYLIRAPASETELTEYQRDVLRLMVQGETPEAIAKRLRRSVNAIYSAQSQLRQKLGVATNEQAIVSAVRERLVPLNPD